MKCYWSSHGNKLEAHMWDGSKKHRYAQKLLDEYQKIHGFQGLHPEKWFGKGRLDIFDSVNTILYDFKFGENAVMGAKQFNKYSNAFKGTPIFVVGKLGNFFRQF